MNIDQAIVYDIEVFPNVFTFRAEALNGDWQAIWEISEFQDDRQAFFEFLYWCRQNKIPMIGFRSTFYDYPVVHKIYFNPSITYQEIFAFSKSIIDSNDQWGFVIWTRDEIAPQIDLFRIHHFDNKAKSTSLKALQINMRSRNVVDMPVQVETWLTYDQTKNILIPYNCHDVSETKKFAHFSMTAIEFRISLIEALGADCINYNDSKLGSKILENRLGDDICFTRKNGRKEKRQTIRGSVPLAEVIFPYIFFENPEFQRVLDYLRGQTLTPSELDESDGPAKITTKGVFAGLKATVGGVTYHFGTGGIHGSLSNVKIRSSNQFVIRDIDVASLYPSIAIVNRLFPQHLGERFVDEYANLPKERKQWQAKKGKKCAEANSLKLAANGTYGNSNSPFSVFYDPQFTMTITINGQLMLAMLAERLANVPTLQVIQANTDGITYYIDRQYEPIAAEICKQWEAYTCLVLEDVEYNRMFIADVNSYVAEDMEGNLKQKGRYWFPDPLDHFNAISQSQPPAWHKDLGNIVSIRAAVANMVHGIDVEAYIRAHTDPFDFMLRYKARRGDKLLIDAREIQKTTRYFVSINGGQMMKVSPARGPIGQYKKANGVTDVEYNRVMLETGGQWDARVCTKNKSRYEAVETKIQTGFKVTECNNADDFDWSSVNYAYYVNEAKKLLI